MYKCIHTYTYVYIHIHMYMYILTFTSSLIRIRKWYKRPNMIWWRWRRWGGHGCWRCTKQKVHDIINSRMYIRLYVTVLFLVVCFYVRMYTRMYIRMYTRMYNRMYIRMYTPPLQVSNFKNSQIWMTSNELNWSWLKWNEKEDESTEI